MTQQQKYMAKSLWCQASFRTRLVIICPHHHHQKSMMDKPEKWKKFKTALTRYALVLELDKKSQAVQVAALLKVISKDACEVYSMFTEWDAEGDEPKLTQVLAKFEQYCFNHRQQEAGETYKQYCTAWHKMAQ